MYGFVYVTTNNINGMKYIGQKKYDKYKTWKKYLGSGIYLNRAINKYGKENFSREIIEECETKEILNEREKYWISYYDAMNSDKYYNIACGGDGGRTCYGSTHHASKKVYQYDKDGNFIKEWENARRASEFFNTTPSDICRVCNKREGVKQTCGYQWSYVKYTHLNSKIKEYTGKKPILQLDNEFNIIDEYKDISHINSEIFNKEKVTDCCNFRAITHNGFYWVYKELYNNDTIEKILQMKNKKRKYTSSKQIYQLDNNRNIINTYENSRFASEETGINRNTIQAYCKRGIANHGFDTTGYYWVYEVI